jgi:N-acetylmuramoyl-L-alanine amidase
MHINNHFLFDTNGQIAYRASPNVGSVIRPEALVIHFTAGSSHDSSVDWLCNPTAQASAHLVIGRAGEMTQLVPFNIKAWHAGVSQWQGRSGLNSWSIGIELDNQGMLTREGSAWKSWFKATVPDDQVIQAVHRNGGPLAGWQIYTEAQIAKALDVSIVLARHYGLTAVLGHDDVAPGRKTDPGPAFPMAAFRSRILGRSADEAEQARTLSALNVRTGPGTEFPLAAATPLPINTTIEITGESGIWRAIKTTTQSGEVLIGYVHSAYLAPVSAG